VREPGSRAGRFMADVEPATQRGTSGIAARPFTRLFHELRSLRSRLAVMVGHQRTIMPTARTMEATGWKPPAELSSELPRRRSEGACALSRLCCRRSYRSP